MPRDLKDMYEKLRSDKREMMLHYTISKPDKMTVHLIEDPNSNDESPSHSLLFVDLNHLREVQKRVAPRTLDGYCDGAFDAVPRRVMVNKIKGYQRLVFQVNRRNSATVIFYALMDRKRTEDYDYFYFDMYSTHWLQK